MSRPFAKNNGKTTFAQIKEPLNAGEYIQTKKTKQTYCNPTYCHPNQNLFSQGNYLSLKQAKYFASNPSHYLDHTQLYINLITKLDLNGDIPVISDISGNNYPIKISTEVDPYLVYNIDPSGNLFGNTVCGINNFENYIVYNPPSINNDPGNINNL